MPNRSPEVDEFLRELSHPLKEGIAELRADSDEFSFEDDTGLLKWAAPDRATLTLSDLEDVRAKLPAVVDLVGRWMRATP